MTHSKLIGIDVAALGVLGAMTAATWLLGVAPALEKRETTLREREQLQGRYKEAATLESELADVRRRLAALAAAAEIDTPLNDTALDRITRIGELAEESAVNITDLSPRQTIPGARFNRVPITIAALGPTGAFQTLLARLHAEYPDTQVVALTITATPENAEIPAALQADLVWYMVAAGGADRAGAGGQAGREAAVAPAPAGAP